MDMRPDSPRQGVLNQEVMSGGLRPSILPGPMAWNALPNIIVETCIIH